MSRNAEPQPTAQPARRARWKPLQSLLVLVILAFWARFLLNNWDQLASYPWRLSGLSLLLALAVLMVQILLVGTVWWRALALVGTRFTWRYGLAILLQAQLARYVPGGVWEYAGRYALSAPGGAGKRSMAASMGLEMALQVLSAAVFLAVALLLRQDALPASYLAMAGLIILGSVVFLSPPIFGRLVNLALRLLRRPALPLSIAYSDVTLLFLLALFAHALSGLGFVLFVNGLTPVDWSTAGLLASAFVGAWLIGYLAVFVPTGIGVREGALALLLGGVLPVTVTAAAALGYRVLIALRDLAAALAGMAMARRQAISPDGQETERAPE